MEVVAVMLTVMIVVVLGLDGITNWFEGTLLLAVYVILGIAFFYIPVSGPHGYDSHATGVGAPVITPMATPELSTH